MLPYAYDGVIKCIRMCSDIITDENDIKIIMNRMIDMVDYGKSIKSLYSFNICKGSHI